MSNYIAAAIACKRKVLGERQRAVLSAFGPQCPNPGDALSFSGWSEGRPTCHSTARDQFENGLRSGGSGRSSRTVFAICSISSSLSLSSISSSLRNIGSFARWSSVRSDSNSIARVTNRLSFTCDRPLRTLRLACVMAGGSVFVAEQRLVLTPRQREPYRSLEGSTSRARNDYPKVDTARPQVYSNDRVSHIVYSAIQNSLYSFGPRGQVACRRLLPSSTGYVQRGFHVNFVCPIRF